MSVRRISSRLRRILHSLATRVPKIILHRAEVIFPALTTSMTVCVTEVEIVSRQEIGHLAVPQIIYVKPENCINNVEYSCDLDNKLFTEETNVKGHRAECSFLCDVCKKVFKSHKSLQVHKCIHSRQCRGSCDVCQKVIKKRNYLQVHKRIHSGEFCYSCDVCGKSFVQLSHLRGHVQIHSGKRPFFCDVCNKSFTERRNYKRHCQTIHCGEQSFSCDVCKKSYSSLSDLKRHLLIHSGKRSFVCSVCKKSFTQLATLKRHELIHSGDRPYSCDVCKESFTRLHILRVHLKTHKRCAGSFSQHSAELEPWTFVARIYPSYLIPLHFPSSTELSSHVCVLEVITLNVAAYK